jgi:small subunit ribosomal protein S24e
MKLELIKDRETPLLSRTRVTLGLEYEGATPSRLQLRKEVAGKLKVDESLVVLKHIYTRFGQHKAKIIAHVYKNADDLKRIEDEYMTVKHLDKEGKAKAKEARQAAKAAGKAK